MTQDPHAAHFWQGCEKGELRYQQCSGCSRVQFFPRAFCARCGVEQLDWRVSSAQGTVYAVTEVERAPTAEFRALQPYAIVLIDMDEGFRIMAHGELGLNIGDRVRAEFFAFQGRFLPRFRK